MQVSSSIMVALVVYLAVILCIGLFVGRKNKNASDYLVGSKQIPTGVLILTLTATIFGGGLFVGRAQLAYISGVPYVMFGACNLIGFAFAALMLPKMKGFMKYTTVTEYLGARYGGKFVRTSCALLSLIALIGLCAIQVNSLVSILSTMGFGDPRLIAFFCMLAIVALTVFGGFLAVTATDAVQISIVMVGSILLLVSILRTNGGVGGLFSAVQAAQGDVLPEGYFNLFARGTTGTIVALTIPSAMYMMIGQDAYQRLLSASSIKESRKVAIGAGILIWLIALPPIIFGIAGRLNFPELEAAGNTASTLGLVIMKYLPNAFGGILLCAVLSAILSTGDSCLSAAGSHFVTDIYCVYIDKNADLGSKKMLTVSRLACLFGGIIAMVLAFAFKGGTISGYVVYCYDIYIGGAFIPIVLGCLWKKANRLGATCGIIVGCGLVIASLFGFQVGSISMDVIAALAALVVTVVVSLLTQEICPPIEISED